MTVEHVIEVLSKFDKDKIVIVDNTEWWSNIKNIVEQSNTINIILDEGKED